MIAATVLYVATTMDGQIVAWQGAIMLGLMAAYVVWSYRQGLKWAGLGLLQITACGYLRVASRAPQPHN